MPLDKRALLAHIKAKADHPNLLIHSVLAGLVTAIERGDFDEQNPHIILPEMKKGAKNDGTTVV